MAVDQGRLRRLLQTLVREEVRQGEVPHGRAHRRSGENQPHRTHQSTLRTAPRGRGGAAAAAFVAVGRCLDVGGVEGRVPRHGRQGEGVHHDGLDLDDFWPKMNRSFANPRVFRVCWSVEYVLEPVATYGGHVDTDGGNAVTRQLGSRPLKYERKAVKYGIGFELDSQYIAVTCCRLS